MTSVFGAARLVLMNTNGGDAVRRVLVAGSSDHRRTDYLATQLPHFAPLIRLHRGGGSGGRLVEEEEEEERETGRTEEGDNCSHWWRSR